MIDAKQIAKQIKESGLTIEQIQAEMERPKRIEELLREGFNSINAVKDAYGPVGGAWTTAGNSFPNKHSAQRAAKARLQRDRLEAYVAQENPDWDGLTDAALIYQDDDGDWSVNTGSGWAEFGAIKMPYQFAITLCNKLNNGEIEL